MKKLCLLTALMALALLLSGCGGGAPAADTPAPETASPAPSPVPTEVVTGRWADAVRALMAPYDAALLEAAARSQDTIAYTIPGDVLMQWAKDAADLNAQAEGGRVAFTWHAAVEASYTATIDDAQAEIDALRPDVSPDPLSTPDPENTQPKDDQQQGDYAVAGGGLFDRTRVYDVAEGLGSGTAEITELLNGEMTGQELFSFALRGGDLYFVDAALDVSADLDELVIQEGYLVAVGVLRPSGLDTVEYHLADPSRLPDPATLNWAQLLSSVTPVSRLSITAAQPTP